MKRNKLYSILIFFPVSIFLSSWGWVGHQKISLNISLSFTEEMAQFEDWVPFLKEHASDADNRKRTDPLEGKRHYIDIDAYPEFISTGAISTSLDTCIALHGPDFVNSQGYLPWATLNTYNKLVEYLELGEWENAKIAAADLGHYVADGFIPLHLTLNYDGEDTGNDGIHSRYESGMIGQYQYDILYEGSPVEEIEDVTSYVFGYIYQNYQFLDDILDADNTARSADASYGSLYTQTLWEETGDFTIELFKNASHAFANLIYNAWKEAGKPDFNGSAVYISEETAYLPDFIGVQYEGVGVIYLVPENTEKDLAIIRTASLDSLNALINYEVEVPVAGLSAGNYWIYARDYAGSLSGPAMFTLTTSVLQTVLAETVTVYPNPFVQSTNIEFTLSQNDHMSVKIMDSNGRLIELLQSGDMHAGSHQLTWKSMHHTPGVYFVVFEAGERVYSKRIIKY